MSRKAVSGTTLILLSASLLFSSLIPFVRPTVYEHPRNFSEAWDMGFRGIVEPENPVVLQQLHDLCPIIDAEHFTVNFLTVYTYSMLITYVNDSDVWGVPDFWQTSEETILLGCGDCEDQAINLATLIEALYKETYGYIPSNLVWVVGGWVVVSGDEGGHAWVLVNEGAIPKETIEEIKSVSIIEVIIDVILQGIAWTSDLIAYIEGKLDLAALDSKQNNLLSIFYSGERYFELEPTWNLPISEFYFKKYPYTEVWVIFNSETYDPYPDFYPVEQPPYFSAEIKNIAFPIRVVVGDVFTLNVTIQNYDCGVLGADMVVILKNYGLEVARQNAYVFKYWWQIHTFVFTLQAIEPAQIEQLSVELYWNNWGQWLLQDFENFTIETISNKPDLVPFSSIIYPRYACEGHLVVFHAFGQNLGPTPTGSWALNVSIDGQHFDSIWSTSCNAFSGFHIQSKPWIAKAGTHFLRLAVDATNVVSEHNETNNEIVLPFEIRTCVGSYVYVQVDSSSDDVQKWNNTIGAGWQWDLTFDWNVAGCPYALVGEDNYGSGLRFTNITIPQGAVINYARLELCAAWDDESSVKTKIFGQDAGDTLPFSTLTDFDARNWTSTFVYWDDIPAWETYRWYTSPDISGIIQGIINRTDWQSGNSIVIVWEDFESRSISYIENARRAWSYDGNSTLAPKILINYEDVIYIRADGSVDPLTAPVLSVDNVTYYFTKNIYGKIMVERSNIIIDGNGYTLQGSGSGYGFNLASISNVTIRNTNIKNFEHGIHLYSSSNNSISGNTIRNNQYGIHLEDSSNNSICHNDFINNTVQVGSWVEQDPNNDITINNSTCITVTTMDRSVDAWYYNYYGAEYFNTSEGWHHRFRFRGTGGNGGGVAVVYQITNSPNEDWLENVLNNRDYLTLWLDRGGPNVILTLGNSTGHSDSDSHSYIENNWYYVDIKYFSNGTCIAQFYSDKAYTDFLFKLTQTHKLADMQYCAVVKSYNSGDVGTVSFNVADLQFYVAGDWTVELWDSRNIWDNGYPSGGNYWSNYNGTDLYSGPYQNVTGSDGIGDTSYVIDANNQDNYPLMKPYGGLYDIGIIDIITSKTVVGQGYNLNITVKILNYGINSETFNITINANATVINQTQITLTRRNSTIVTFTWNTTGVAKGNYTITAKATQLPYETDTTDNTLTDGWIIIAMIGDITGPDGWPDGTCNIRDVALAAKAFGANLVTDPTSPKYGEYWHDPPCNTCPHSPNCDLTGPTPGLPDGKINIRDIALVASHFGETDP